MKKFKKLAMENTIAAYIYFAAMLAVAATPLIALNLLLYAAGCR